MNNCVLGIEFGSTRIKAVLINEKHETVALGVHDWENRLDNGIWTYTLEDIWGGVQDAYANLAKDVAEKTGQELTTVKAIGFSAMMHGYHTRSQKLPYSGRSVQHRAHGRERKWWSAR